MPPTVKVALSMYDAVNDGDLEAVLGLVTEDVQIRTTAPQSMGVARVGSGHEGIREWWAAMHAHGRQPRLIVHESREVAGRAVCKLAATNVLGGVYEVAWVIWTVVTVDERGLVTANWSFGDEESALAAAKSGRPQ
jgi:ketosteroid isomerase-like protein